MYKCHKEPMLPRARLLLTGFWLLPEKALLTLFAYTSSSLITRCLFERAFYACDANRASRAD